MIPLKQLDLAAPGTVFRTSGFFQLQCRMRLTNHPGYDLNAFEGFYHPGSDGWHFYTKAYRDEHYDRGALDPALKDTYSEEREKQALDELKEETRRRREASQ